jgi:fumarate hydratase class II
VQSDALWGKQTASAVEHFDFGADERMPMPLLHALAAIKSAAALVNGRSGRLSALLARAIEEAADEVAAGRHDAQFPLSIWQSGSGTQSNMNVNEVVARLAQERLRGSANEHTVHPNDHVNLGQSSNDTVPSAMHLAALAAVQQRLLPALDRLAQTLHDKALGWADLVKLGRTHLQDAVPMTLGQEAGAWHSQLTSARGAVEATLPPLHSLALGGTAVGTGLNAPVGFADAVCKELTARTGLPVHPASDPFAALAGHEPLVALHGALKVLAVALMKIANDIRLLGSGPRGGFGELLLPANEPGSSIMPGKVNPTQCESLVMVAIQVIANDGAVTLGAGAGHLQLNTCKPLIAANLLRSVRLLATGVESFERHCVSGLQADPKRLAELMERSLMLVTALAPHIGYDRAARIARHAHEEGLTLREAALAEGLSDEQFDEWVRPAQMARPSR